MLVAAKIKQGSVSKYRSQQKGELQVSASIKYMTRNTLIFFHYEKSCIIITTFMIKKTNLPWILKLFAI